MYKVLFRGEAFDFLGTEEEAEELIEYQIYLTKLIYGRHTREPKRFWHNYEIVPV